MKPKYLGGGEGGGGKPSALEGCGVIYHHIRLLVVQIIFMRIGVTDDGSLKIGQCKASLKIALLQSLSNDITNNNMALFSKQSWK